MNNDSMRIPEPVLFTEYRSSLKRLIGAAFVLFLIVILGTFGAYFLEEDNSILDCLYFTIITITTIGYREAIPVNNDATKLFVIFIAVLGMGAMLWFVTNLTAFVFEGHLYAVRRRKNIMKKLNEIRDHAIICGAGKTGSHVVNEFEATGQAYVVIDTDSTALERIALDHPGALVIHGDATDDHVLHEAKIERAKGLIAVLRDDRDNTFVVLSAKTINPKLMIISRASEGIGHKLLRAGANAVVSPNYIGGMRIASQYLRPTAVDFLDAMLRDPNFTWRIEDVEIREDSSMADKTLSQLSLRSRFEVLILAIRRKGSKKFIMNPDAEEMLHPGDVIVVTAEKENLNRLRKL